jgi:hypothetical protein
VTEASAGQPIRLGPAANLQLRKVKGLEPLAQPRQLHFNPRPMPYAPKPSGNGSDEHATEVADIKAAERNRRAAE